MKIVFVFIFLAYQNVESIPFPGVTRSVSEIISTLHSLKMKIIDFITSIINGIIDLIPDIIKQPIKKVKDFLIDYIAKPIINLIKTVLDYITPQWVKDIIASWFPDPKSQLLCFDCHYNETTINSTHCFTDFSFSQYCKTKNYCYKSIMIGKSNRCSTTPYNSTPTTPQHFYISKKNFLFQMKTDT